MSKRKADGQPNAGDDDEKNGGGGARADAGGGQRLSKRQKQERIDELPALIDAKQDAEEWAAMLALSDELVALDPNNVVGHHQRGYALDELCRYEEAIAAYTRCLEIDPNETSALIGRAKALNEVQRFEEAIADSTRAIQLDAAHPGASAFGIRAFALSSLHKLEQSLEDEQAAVRLAPREPVYRRNRAITLFKLHEYDRALADCNMVLDELDAAPDDRAACHYRRAQCRDALSHDAKLVLADYRAALTLRQHLQDNFVDTAEEAVARLEGIVKQQAAAAANAAAVSQSASASSSQLTQLATWSAQKVGEWIRSMGKAYEGYAAAFVDNGITGQLLLKELQKEERAQDLLETYLGVANPLHRGRIILEVQNVLTAEKQQAEQKEKEEKEEKRRERNACSICMDRERCITFLPCGHFCACEECAKRIMAGGNGGGGTAGQAAAAAAAGSPKCPMCKQAATEAKRIFTM